jgi:hypothetical protein
LPLDESSVAGQTLYYFQSLNQSVYGYGNGAAFTLTALHLGRFFVDFAWTFGFYYPPEEVL